MASLSSTLNMFLDAASESGVITAPLFVNGASSATNLTSVTPLYISSESFWNDLNLFIKADTFTQMNLFVAGTTLFSEMVTPLVLWNTQTVAEAATELFIQGAGITPEAMDAASELNLFIAQDPSEAVPLYICGPGNRLTGEASVYISGTEFEESTFTITVTGVGYLSDEPTLFIHGF